MALTTIGLLCTFSLGGTTTAGVVIGKPNTTTDRVAYMFRSIAGDRVTWAKEADTTATTVVTGSV
ncbi:MAG TPA: hypothetical protein VJS69_02455 [Candidatus Krumholzibacteria bacterium]|nr:hypothetical protein [Candidatus Krumholzibacteria bacterium]